MNMRLRNNIELMDAKTFDSRKDRSIGLADGRMGQCIYFYHIGRLLNSKDYSQKAELMIDEIFNQVVTLKMFDINAGLAGIALGLEYLVDNKYVDGNINEILRDVDDILFKQICNPERELDIEHIIEEELVDNLFFSNGLCGIYFLLSGLGDFYSKEQICRYKNLIATRIEKSSIWNRLLDNEDYLLLNNGLFSGYTGLSLLLHKRTYSNSNFCVTLLRQNAHLQQ